MLKLSLTRPSIHVLIIYLFSNKILEVILKMPNGSICRPRGRLRRSPDLCSRLIQDLVMSLASNHFSVFEMTSIQIERKGSIGIVTKF
jgi:hypothetical protein